MEYLTTIHYFDRLFIPNSRIIDVCAGTGSYSFYLANKGHFVTACDLAERHIDIIKSKPNANKLSDISVCNALDLSQFNENHFDVVLCMGALYHLDLKGQKKAISESVRVCKSCGIIVFTYLHTQEIIDRLKNIFFSLTRYEMEALAIEYGLEQKHNIYTFSGGYDEIISGLNDEEFSKHMEQHLLTREDSSVVETGGLGLWIGKKP